MKCDFGLFDCLKKCIQSAKKKDMEGENEWQYSIKVQNNGNKAY